MLILASSFLYWVLAMTLEQEDLHFLANRVHELQTILQQQPEDAKALERDKLLNYLQQMGVCKCKLTTCGLKVLD